MAQSWETKSATEVVERRWLVPLSSGDSIASVSASASGVTVDGAIPSEDEAVVTLSAGANGVPASITVTVGTTNGLTLIETFYMDIAATTAALGQTAGDVLSYAMRKVFGVGETADAANTENALEVLNDMLAEWKGRKVDVGAVLPLATTTVMAIPDHYISAIKTNLLIALADQFGREVDSAVVRRAAVGFELVKQSLSSHEKAEYF